MRFVIELAAEKLSPLASVARREFTGRSFNAISVIESRDQCQMDYQSSRLELEAVLRELDRGTFAAVMLSQEGESSEFVLIRAPHFADDGFSYWSLLLESETLPSSDEIEYLRGLDALRYGAVSAEDSLDIMRDSDIEVANFPWSHWRLVYAFVRNDDYTWKERRGIALPELDLASFHANLE